MSVPIRAGLPAPGQQGRPAVFGCGKGQWQGCRWRGQEHDEHRGAAGAVSVAPRYAKAARTLESLGIVQRGMMSTEELQELFQLHLLVLAMDKGMRVGPRT
eukprot:scaffold167193_cov20-Tisochrysis_lutea.AAC.1